MDAEKGSVARWGLHCLLRLDRIESGEVWMKEETKMRTTAQVLVDCLEAEGVDVLFGIRCVMSRARPLWRMSMAV